MLPARDQNGSSAASLSSSLCALKKILLTNAIFSFFINLMLLAPSLYMMQVYNRVLPSQSGATLAMLTGLVGFTLTALGALETVRTQMMVRLGGKLELDLNQRVIEATFLATLRSDERKVRQPLSDFDRIRSFIWSPVPSALFDIFWAPLFILVVFLFHPLLGSIALGGSVVLFGVALVHHLMTGPHLEAASRRAADATSFMERSLRNAQTLEAMGMLANLQQRWLRQRNETSHMQARAADRTGLLAGVTKSVRFLLQIVLLCCGALLVIEDEITPGVIIAASMLMARALAPLETTIGAWRQCVGVYGAYARLEDLLREAPPRRRRISLPAPRGALRLEEIVAWLPGSTEPILQGVNFTLAAGDILAVVGASGSGKSTLLRLIVGALPPYAGKVHLDEAEMQLWNREELGPCLGYLPQEVELFEGTIAENIARFGELDSRKIVNAAQRAGVHEMILGLPQGYETCLGPRGASLSGGQRQRIALARAMYGDPVLVVLDEPNSSLDEAGDAALAAGIMALKARGTTFVVMTHRTSILPVVDKMMVLRDGQVQAFGPRDEVIAALNKAAQQVQQQRAATAVATT